MGERKVLNRYIPPDFDPSIIPKFKRDKDKLIEVRMMLPFSMRCNTCGEYMYRGKKFNSKSEIVKDDTYMGIRKFRFYIKCSHCSAEITFKTDPKNSDYECESGASRNFELWRDNAAEVELVEKERQEEEEMDAMKALENRTMDNKHEMDVLDALDEIKALNYRHERLDSRKVIDLLDQRHNQTSHPSNPNSNPNPNPNDLSLNQEEEEALKAIKQRSASSVKNTTLPFPVSIPSSEKKAGGATAVPVIVRKRKIETAPSTSSSSISLANKETEEPLKKQTRSSPCPSDAVSSTVVAKEEKEAVKEVEEDKKRGSSSESIANLLFDYGQSDGEEQEEQ